MTLPGPVRIQVRLGSSTRLRRVGLMRDGRILQWLPLEDRCAAPELDDDAAAGGDHWYVVTAEADAAAGGPPVLAHASPFFVTVAS